jgi:hypothetical protein
LGLGEPTLFNNSSDGADSKEVNELKINELTIQQWLETAVEHYRNTHL